LIQSCRSVFGLHFRQADCNLVALLYIPQRHRHFRNYFRIMKADRVTSGTLVSVT